MDQQPEHIPDRLTELDDFLAKRESSYSLKEDTQARIIWNSSYRKQQTDFSVVYLHGFRASHAEGHPVHKVIAEKFGWNLFLSRHEDHGLETAYPLLNLTEEKLLDSARFALKMGLRLGKKVILMGTSTGGSLALYLAARSEYRHRLGGLVLYSPLISFFGVKENLLKNPWARKLLAMFPGRTHLVQTAPGNFEENRIWYQTYALQGALALGSFVQHQMQNELFGQVRCPVFTGFYYKNRKEQDRVVSVHAIRKMTRNLGARTQFVKVVNFPGAKSHVICSSLLSKAVKNVIAKTEKFLKVVASQEATEKRP